MPIPEQLAAALSDRYRVERELGAGGMATVYLAEDLKHDRKVAIKVLHPDLAAALGAQRFLTEIKTTANLQHPHILPLHDSGEADGLLFYVMPFVEGESLRDRLNREKPLPIEDAVGIAREVADALDYAHRHGVIHRDIKPENILLHDRRALVADFGIALAVQSAAGARMTQTGLSLGTPHYMSPEQAMGEKQIDARSDVYALGAMLYEMLTGDPPFTGSTVQAIVAKVMSAEPEPVTMLRKNTPESVAYAVHRALEKLPADRFATAAEFAAALSAPPQHGAAAAARPGAQHAADWRTMLRLPAIIALAAVAVAAVAFAGYERHAAGRTGGDDTVQRFTVEPPPGVDPTVYRQSQLNVALSPDGTVLVFAAIDGEGTQRLYARRMDALNARPLPGTEGGEQPFFSPDGQSVAFWVAGRLLQVGLAGGTPQRIADLPNMTGATWTNGGIIVASVDNRLVWFPANDAAKQHTAPLDAAGHEDLQYYPIALSDGNHVVYASWAGGGLETVHLGVLSLSSGKVHRTATPGLGALGMLDGILVYGTSSGELIGARFDVDAGAVAGPGRPLLNDVAQGNRGVELAALSRAGTLVYATGTGQSALVVADSAGETPLVPGLREYSFPRYAPDGKRLAIAISTGATRDVWLYDFATKGLRRLTSGGTVNERPEWTPDGTRVLFRSDRGPRSAIWWQPVDASAPPSELEADPRAAYYEGIISPDGRTLVYQVDTSTADLYYRALSGDTTPHAAVSGPAQDFEARLSPDGHWLAYQTDLSGTMQIMVQAFPGPGPRIPISTGGGTEPVWSRDGRRLFYRGSGHFVVVSVSTTPSFRVVSRANFMTDRYISAPAPHANYDVSPDGRRLLVLKGDAQRLVVAHNWWSEARARMRGDSLP